MVKVKNVTKGAPKIQGQTMTMRRNKRGRGVEGEMRV